MAQRDRKIITILGKKRVGKTVLARQYYAAHPGPFKHVADPSGSWTQGYFPADAFQNKKSLENWFNKLTGNGRGPPHGVVPMEGGLLILDDADDYVSAAPYSFWKTLWNRNAHLRLDLIVTAHRPQGIPKDLIANSDQLILFPMGEKYAIEYLAEINGLEGLRKRAMEKHSDGILRPTGEYLVKLPTEKFHALVFTPETGNLSSLVVKP